MQVEKTIVRVRSMSWDMMLVFLGRRGGKGNMGARGPQTDVY